MVSSTGRARPSGHAANPCAPRAHFCAGCWARVKLGRHAGRIRLIVLHITMAANRQPIRPSRHCTPSDAPNTKQSASEASSGKRWGPVVSLRGTDATTGKLSGSPARSQRPPIPGLRAAAGILARPSTKTKAPDVPGPTASPPGGDSFAPCHRLQCQWADPEMRETLHPFPASETRPYELINQLLDLHLSCSKMRRQPQ